MNLDNLFAGPEPTLSMPTTYRHDAAAWERVQAALSGRPRIDGYGIPTRTQNKQALGRAFVYVLFDRDNHPCYLGSTKNLRERLNDHRKGPNDRGRHRWYAVECPDWPSARDLETALLTTYTPYLNRRRAA